MRFVAGLWLVLLLATAVVAATTACQPAPAPRPPTMPTLDPPITLRIGLTDSAYFIPDLVSSPFSNYNDQIKLQFVLANDAALLADLQNGQLDAILIHHLPSESEFWFNPVALDGVVLFVHPDNPLTDLSLASAQAVFSGEINNWSQLGGTDEPIHLISREAGSGAHEIFTQRILAPARLDINAQIVANETAVQQTIALDPFAIGYGMAGGMDTATPITLAGIAANPTELANQNYPVSVPLYFVSKTEPQDELRAFLGWLQSEMGQLVLGQRYGRIR